jgi:hypothetical protein
MFGRLKIGYDFIKLGMGFPFGKKGLIDREILLLDCGLVENLGQV